MSQDEIEMVIIDTAENTKKNEWMRTFGFKRDKIYIPIKMFPNRKEIFLCACIDGIEIVNAKKNIYVDSDWIIKEFKQYKDHVEKLTYLMRNRLKEDGYYE